MYNGIVSQNTCFNFQARFKWLEMAVPLGVPYVVLRKGYYWAGKNDFREIPKTLIWLEDIEGAQNRRHFTVKIVRDGEEMPVTKYVDGNYGFPRVLRDLARRLPKSHKIKRRILDKEIEENAPKDRKIPPVMTRVGRCDAINPHVTTEVSVVAGVRIGHRYFSEEGYNCVRYGSQAKPFLK